MKIISSKSITILLVLFLIPHVIYAAEKFAVQAGAFFSRENAQNVITVLRSHGIQCAIYEQKGLFKVHCGDFIKKTQADVLRKKVASIGYDAFVILKIIHSLQDSPKGDTFSGQSEKPLMVKQSTEQPANAPQSEKSETEKTISTQAASPPDVSQSIQEKFEAKKEDQEHETIPIPRAPVLFDRVVAVVNKEVITWSELYKAMEFQAAPQLKKLSNEERNKVFKQSEGSLLESLIDMRLQLQEAEKLGFEVTQKEITETIETIQKKYSMTQADFTESLKKEGLSFDEYKKRLSEQILINKVVTHQIRNKITVTDDLIKKYMEEHKEDFTGNEKYKLRQIFFKNNVGAVDTKTVEDRAALIIRRLKDGEDFSALARIYSDDSSGKIGGDLGFVSKDLLAKEFVEVLSNMHEGDNSMPFWTEKGLHIIKLDEIVSVQNMDKIKDDVRKKSTEEQLAERYKSWVKGLREKAYIAVRQAETF
jgi:peptidyl-prolyl cis-trans isomerase SurA